MADRASPDLIDTDEPEQKVGPVTVSRHTDMCSICDWPYMAGVTPVVRTSWGRTVHPACLAPPITDRPRPRRRN